MYFYTNEDELKVDVYVNVNLYESYDIDIDQKNSTHLMVPNQQYN